MSADMAWKIQVCLPYYQYTPHQVTDWFLGPSPIGCDSSPNNLGIQ
jgi:hypothetical protein